MKIFVKIVSVLLFVYSVLAIFGGIDNILSMDNATERAIGEASIWSGPFSSLIAGLAWVIIDATNRLCPAAPEKRKAGELL
jgi:hypothetical protein